MLQTHVTVRRGLVQPYRWLYGDDARAGEYLLWLFWWMRPME